MILKHTNPKHIFILTWREDKRVLFEASFLAPKDQNITTSRDNHVTVHTVQTHIPTVKGINRQQQQVDELTQMKPRRLNWLRI